MSNSLFSLTGQYLALAHQLADADFDAATVADTIEASGIVDNITDKVQAVEFVARGAESHNLAIDAEIARLQALKAHRVKVAQGLRDYIKTSMESMGMERIDCPLFQITIKRNPPSVDIYDPLSLPVEYMTVPKTPAPVADKKAIAAAIKSGVDVPGAKLNQTTRLAVA